MHSSLQTQCSSLEFSQKPLVLLWMPSSLWWIKYVIFSHSSLLEAELKLLAYKWFEQSELVLILNLKTWLLFLFMVLCILSCYLFIQRTYGKSTWRIKTLKFQRERSPAISADASLPDIHNLSDNQTSLSCWDVQWLEYRLTSHGTITHWAINHTIKNDAFC